MFYVNRSQQQLAALCQRTVFIIMVHKKILPIVFWVLLWQAVSMWIAQDLILVSPCAVGLRLLELMQEASFW